MDGRDTRRARFGTGYTPVSIRIPLLPVAARWLSRLRRLSRLGLLLPLRLLVYRLCLLACPVSENHANRTAPKQCAFQHRLFATIYRQSIFELHLDYGVRKPAAIQRRSPFRKVFAAFLMTIHSWRRKRQIKQIV